MRRPLPLLVVAILLLGTTIPFIAVDAIPLPSNLSNRADLRDVQAQIDNGQLVWLGIGETTIANQTRAGSIIARGEIIGKTIKVLLSQL